jgi:hypothetical protein
MWSMFVWHWFSKAGKRWRDPKTIRHLEQFYDVGQ